jgi:ubiquinone/menaquinone biosynthesis C-methylase UbiE
MNTEYILTKNTDKSQVHDFWNSTACGEALYLQATDKLGYMSQSAERYRLEPFILTFANFDSAKGKKVLEIGVGLGADHQRFAESGCELYGIDLTERAVVHTRKRLALFDLSSTITVGDAENLDLPDNSFDIVYSYGVLHHSPDTQKAVCEVNRVLKPGGCAKIMIYHYWSVMGVMLWLRYALFLGRPWRSLNQIYAQYLESPGTKAYSIPQAYQLFAQFSNIEITTCLSHGDLLASNAGQRHRGIILTIAKKLWPRWLIRRFLPSAGLLMFIEAYK